MSDIPHEDIKKAIGILELGTKKNELSSPIAEIQKQLIDPHKAKDPSCELRFNDKLDHKSSNKRERCQR